MSDGRLLSDESDGRLLSDESDGLVLSVLLVLRDCSNDLCLVTS